ncbi:PQQ-binding-like beta-propeller repeat protein [bacterium]|nr:PQQ-binding-like beta-propeller repeat protein [bacterium]
MEERRIGRFRVLSEHARGGMGDLLRAQDETLNRPVALKLLRPERLLEEGAVARFRREALTVARLKHDHIAALYEFGDDPQQPYLAMEWVDGHSLEELLRSGPLGMDRALSIMAQLLGALDYAHSQGVIHHDIKPANLMLSNGRLTVVDFGLASLLTEPTVMETGPLYCTPLYMAPEMAAGNAVDGRADLYSAALVFFEMLAGRPAFGPGSVTQIVAQQVNGPRPILSEYQPKLPTSLDPILVKALDTDPSKRYASGAQLLSAIQSVLTPKARSGLVWPLAAALVLTVSGAVAMNKAPLLPHPTPVPLLQEVWHHPAPYAPWLVRGRQLLVDSQTELLSLDGQLAEIRWRVPQTSPAKLLLDTETAICRLAQDGKLEAFEPAKGRQLWKVPLSLEPERASVSSDDEVYFSTSTRLLAFDPTAPQEEWDIQIAPSSLAAVGDETRVVVAGGKRQLTAYAYADSQKAWRRTVPAEVNCLWLGEAGLMVGCQDGSLLALNATDGSTDWQTESVEASPVEILEGDDNWLVAAWRDGELVGFDSNGNEAWKLQLGERPVGLHLLKDRLLVAGANNRLLCLDVAHGRQLWQASTRGPCQSAPRWLGSSRLVVPLKDQLVVYQVDPRTPP